MKRASSAQLQARQLTTEVPRQPILVTDKWRRKFFLRFVQTDQHYALISTAFGSTNFLSQYLGYTTGSQKALGTWQPLIDLQVSHNVTGSYPRVYTLGNRQPTIIWQECSRFPEEQWKGDVQNQWWWKLLVPFTGTHCLWHRTQMRKLLVKARSMNYWWIQRPDGLCKSVEFTHWTPGRSILIWSSGQFSCVLPHDLGIKGTSGTATNHSHQGNKSSPSGKA